MTPFAFIACTARHRRFPRVFESPDPLPLCLDHRRDVIVGDVTWLGARDLAGTPALIGVGDIGRRWNDYVGTPMGISCSWLVLADRVVLREISLTPWPADDGARVVPGVDLHVWKGLV
jgi:hypothetical protein